MKMIDQNDTDHVEVWSDDSAEKEVGKEMYADGWGMVVGSRWLMGIIVFLVLVIAFLGYRLSQVTRIDLSNFPIATIVLSPEGKYIQTAVARGKMIDRDELVPERMEAIIKAWREVVPSAATMQENRDFVARHLDPGPAEAVAMQLEKFPPEKMWTEKSHLRRIIVTGIVPQNRGSGDTWTVLWREEVYMPGRAALISSSEVTASITIRFEVPTDNDGIVRNALGLRWTALEWSNRRTFGDGSDGS